MTTNTKIILVAVLGVVGFQAYKKLQKTKPILVINNTNQLVPDVIGQITDPTMLAGLRGLR